MDEINKLNGCGSKPQTRLGTLNSWLMDVLFSPPYSYSPKNMVNSQVLTHPRNGEMVINHGNFSRVAPFWSQCCVILLNMIAWDSLHLFPNTFCLPIPCRSLYSRVSVLVSTFILLSSVTAIGRNYHGHL